MGLSIKKGKVTGGKKGYEYSIVRAAEGRGQVERRVVGLKTKGFKKAGGSDSEQIWERKTPAPKAEKADA